LQVYIDATALVDAELRALPGDTVDAFHAAPSGDGARGESAAEAAAAAFAWGSVVMGPDPLDPGSAFDRRLAAGAGLACRLRGAIHSELAFTSSAGISNNKLLAKLGSAMHKPNQQTLIPPRAAPGVVAALPLGRLRNFGGKLGQQLEALGCATAGDVQGLPPDTLRRHFGERAAGIALAVRGYSGETVAEKERPKSMLAAKSFAATSGEFRAAAAADGWRRTRPCWSAATLGAQQLVDVGWVAGWLVT
jgi:nucleotidyltransferase/DNA polymerase involved in DNA repair